MVKKIAVAAGAAALLIAMTTPALGNGDSGIKVENEGTAVITVAGSRANSGDNLQRGGRGFQWMSTGNAGASSVALANVNNTGINVRCRCLRRGGGGIKVENEGTFVLTTALAGADTGGNTQMSWGGHHRHGRWGHHGISQQSMETGDAGASSLADSWVNLTSITLR